MLSPETILQDRYRIIRQLGQGGMGAVYEAVDLRLDTTVALKETLFTDEKLRKQFEREARLLARLHHQALPRVSDHFNEGDGQFLVMQYVAGDDLFEMQNARKGPFPQAEVLLWGDQLCDALEYLHSQDPQIIHRDIKPQNLKLSERGQIVLLDFGLAKGSAGTMSVVTASASIFGYTPNYAPLEQIQGQGTDTRSDIYSLAATLYHLLTNIKPPDALSRASAMVNSQPDPLQPAHTVAPQVSAGVANVLNRAMSQKRDDRYPSAQSMREALKAATLSQEALGEAATVLATGVMASSEQRTQLMGGAKTATGGSEARTLVAPGAVTQAAVIETAGETVTRVQAARPATRSRSWLAALAAVLLIGGVAVAYYAYRAKHAVAAQGDSSNAGSPTQSPAPNGAVNSPSAQPVESPAQAIVSVATNPKSGKGKAEADPNPRTSSAEPRPEKLPAPSPVASDPTHADPNRNRGRNAGNETPPPNPDPNRDPNQRRNPQAPDVRVFPNGTRIVRQPDGSRIVTYPNGRTQVIPAGENPPRRRRP